MTPDELVVSFLCLVGGYWIVTAAMNRAGRQQRDQGYRAEHSAGSDGSANQDSNNQAHGASRANPRDLKWFEVLGVSEFSSREQITAAYKRKISEYHPDKVAKMGSEIVALAELKSKQINAAYESALKTRR